MSPAPARVDELKKRYEENPRRFFAPLANEYRKAGELEAAIDLCRTHLEEQPGHLSGHIVYGQALYESQRAGDAKAAFESALTLDPENLIALRHLGDIARGEGDASTATHWYQRVLDADPRNDEVIALIAALKQDAPRSSTVVVAVEAPPPPAPSYAEIAAEEAAARASMAETPIIPIAAVSPPAIAARGSIGLMDLDLDLGETATPTVDLMSVVASTPSAPAVEAPAVEAPAVEPPAVEAPAVEAPAPDMPVPDAPAPALPMFAADDVLAVDEAAPAFEEGFPIAEGLLHVSTSEGPELLGADDTNRGLAAPDDTVLDVLDTHFGALPVEEQSMFAAAYEPSSFGDSLDITVASDFEQSPPPPPSLDAMPPREFASQGPIVEPITSTSGLTAEPAPATPGDFDMLFGHAPIADVQVGGDGAPPQADDAGFTADAFIGREPSDAMLDSAPDVTTPPSPFVTETMAELYLQQGFRDEALDVYRQLLALNPGDSSLADRVSHLEHGTRSSLAIDSVSEEIEAVAAADELRRSGSIPTVPATADHVPMLPDAVPAFLVEPPAVEAAAPVPLVVPVPRGPSVREVLARIAQRRAIPGGGFAQPAAEPVTLPHPVPTYDTGWTPPADVAAAQVAEPALAVPVAAGGAIDRLFGMGGVGTADEGAASAVASAFGAAPATPIRGEPTRQVNDELSLDSVFGGESAQSGAATPPAVQRQSTKLRFDQFFAGVDEGVPSSGQPAPGVPGRGAEDIAQFSDWLKGLKGS